MVIDGKFMIFFPLLSHKTGLDITLKLFSKEKFENTVTSSSFPKKKQKHHLLTLCMLGKNFSRRHFEIIFSYFSYKIGFDTSCKLSLGKIRKNIINLSSADFAHNMVLVLIFKCTRVQGSVLLQITGKLSYDLCLSVNFLVQTSLYLMLNA